MTATALLSECGTYRYTLARSWTDGPTVCWIMLNPSTADAEQDDPTIRRCIGFSKTWGFGGLTVVNLFALRSTDPKALYAHNDPIGPDNDTHIATAARGAGRLVAAWGVHGAFQNRGIQVARHPDLCHLGLTKNGQPRHPLYIKGDTPPSWRWPAVYERLKAGTP